MLQKEQALRSSVQAECSQLKNTLLINAEQAMQHIQVQLDVNHELAGELGKHEDLLQKERALRSSIEQALRSVLQAEFAQLKNTLQEERARRAELEAEKLKFASVQAIEKYTTLCLNSELATEKLKSASLQAKLEEAEQEVEETEIFGTKE